MKALDHRQEVFARIREALTVKAPKRHRPVGDPAASYTDHGSAPEKTNFQAWLPKVGSTVEEQIELFAKNAVQLQASFIGVPSQNEALLRLKEISLQERWVTVATHDHPLASFLAKGLSLEVKQIRAGYDKNDLEKCDVGITGCDALVAQTGSVLVSHHSAGGRALSVLPPHHVVVAQRSQLVPDLASAIRIVRERYAPQWPSFLSFITGPSRTGDIERILVLGAHGPKKLTILMID